MQDIRPFAEALGINKAKLANYRKEFDIVNVEKGTFYLLKQLRESMKSSIYGRENTILYCFEEGGIHWSLSGNPCW